MIFDTLKNRRSYQMGSSRHEITEYLALLKPETTAGSCHAAGCDIHLRRTATRLQAESRYEPPRRMVDVQTVLEGSEWFFYAPAACLRPDGPFDETRDLQFYQKTDIQAARLTLTPACSS